MSDEQSQSALETIKNFRRFNILSIDGGVFDTVARSRIVQLLEDNPKLLRDTDLIIGSETGAVQALFLASRIEVPNDFSGRTLEEQFGGSKMGELYKKVAIPIFVLKNCPDESGCAWNLRVYHNFPGKESDAACDVVDVALKSLTTATLVYTNPAMIGVTQALDPTVGNVKLEQIRLLSLASDSNGLSQVIHSQCQHLLGKRYRRVGKDSKPSEIAAWIRDEWK